MLGRGNAHVALEGPGRLAGYAGLVGFPAQAAYALGLRKVIPHAVRLAFDGTSACRLGCGVGQDVFVGDGLQQAHARYLRRNTRADHDAVGQRAIGQFRHAVERLVQRVARAIGKLALQILVADAHLPLGLYALYSGVVELVTVHRVWHYAAMCAHARDG